MRGAEASAGAISLSSGSSASGTARQRPTEANLPARSVGFDTGAAAIPEQPAPAGPLADITYDPAKNTIRVAGPGSTVTLTEIHDALSHDQMLERLGTSEWYLKADLLISREVKFLLHDQEAGGDVDWLMLKSDSSSFVWLKTWDGQISMDATKVTSWDKQDRTFDDGWGCWRGRDGLQQPVNLAAVLRGWRAIPARCLP